MSIDPLAEDYPYNSPYAIAENKVGMGRELEGCELGPFVTFGSSPITSTPLLGAGDAVKLSGEVGGKATESLTSAGERVMQNASRGKLNEAEQLAKNGLENTKPMEGIDPKTGQSGKTIPDAVNPETKGTVDIKNVQRQSLTRQLRIQKGISEAAGAKPELIINQAAKLSKPLQNAGFDIKTYGAAGVVKDNTSVPTPELPKAVTPSQDKEDFNSENYFRT